MSSALDVWDAFPSPTQPSQRLLERGRIPKRLYQLVTARVATIHSPDTPVLLR